MPAQHEGKIFDQCVFAFIPSNALQDSVIQNMKNEVKKQGGTTLEPNADGTVPVAEVTHLISNTINFPEYIEAMARLVAVVRDLWIPASVERGRQWPVRPFSPDPRMIFSSVVVTSNEEIPGNDKEAIVGAVTAMGGMEAKALNKTTTHLCALSMEGEMCQAAKERLKNVKIVLPHYFDDCFKLGKRIDETPYLLPDPPILRENPQDDVKIPSSAHLAGATSAHPDFMPKTEASRSARTPLLVFSGHQIYLSEDLNIKDRLRTILTELITNGQGKVVENDEEADWFVCQYRSGTKYINAAQQGKVIGNLSWLYHLITFTEWSCPMRQLLHYPIPKEPIPGFEGLEIVVSNYGGEARIYLENLIRACGATFTKSLTPQNTHLITASDTSEKCTAARDWNISMVNHLWVEESYARCHIQALTVGKYTHFPPRTNLGEVIGQTFLDERQVRSLYYPGGEGRLTAHGKRKRMILDEAQRNASAHGPAAGVVIGRQGHNKDFDVMKDSATEAPMIKSEHATPARRSRRQQPGKENQTPSIMSSGSRSAKTNAVARIHGLADDVLLYEKEKKRTAKGGPWGGKRAAEQVDKQLAAARSSSPAPCGTDDSGNENGEAGVGEGRRPSKRARRSLPSVEHRICVTGWRKWVNNKRSEDADKKKLREMGIQIVQEGQPCDYLAAPSMIRTVKFLVTLARGVPILDSAFLDKCLEKGELQDFDQFPLVDKDNERAFGVNLKTSVARAKANKGRLLRGIAIYCTENIKHGYPLYQQIAEANGATFKIYRARSGTTIRPTTAEQDGFQELEPVYLLTSYQPSERALWPKFGRMANEGNMKPMVVKSDWLLTVAMRQEVFSDDSYLAVNEDITMTGR